MKLSKKTASPPETSSPIPAATAAIDRVLELYGDLLFDLCQSLLWNPESAQLAFRAILKTVRRRHASEQFKANERAWVLRIACERLLELTSKGHARRLTPSEQIQLDAAEGAPLRLKQFGSYFHRLTDEDRLLLLLRDKYGLPYPEISAMLEIPESTLKLRRAQALRALEEWLWGESQ